MGEQRYKAVTAVMAVLSDGRTVTEAARHWEVSRQTLRSWGESQPQLTLSPAWTLPDFSFTKP